MCTHGQDNILLMPGELCTCGFWPRKLGSASWQFHLLVVRDHCLCLIAGAQREICMHSVLWDMFRISRDGCWQCVTSPVIQCPKRCPMYPHNYCIKSIGTPLGMAEEEKRWNSKWTWLIYMFVRLLCLLREWYTFLYTSYHSPCELFSRRTKPIWQIAMSLYKNQLRHCHGDRTGREMLLTLCIRVKRSWERRDR